MSARGMEEIKRNESHDWTPTAQAVRGVKAVAFPSHIPGIPVAGDVLHSMLNIRAVPRTGKILVG